MFQVPDSIHMQYPAKSKSNKMYFFVPIFSFIIIIITFYLLSLFYYINTTPTTFNITVICDRCNQNLVAETPDIYVRDSGDLMHLFAKSSFSLTDELTQRGRVTHIWVNI